MLTDAILRSARTHWAAVLVASGLSVIHTWPLATNPAALSLNDNADTQLNEWILAWVVHQFPRDPVRLFDANIFYPATTSLAFSEPLIVPAIMAAPVLLLGGSPVLAYNLVLLVGFTLTVLGAYAVVFSWTGDRPSALVAGSLFGFNTHTLTRLPHLQAIHAYGLPLTILFADRLIRSPSVYGALALAAAMSLMVYTSGYLVVFGTITVAVMLLVRVTEWRRNWRTVLSSFALAAVTTTTIAVPLAVPYRRVAVDHGMVRSLENVRQFSATPSGYLAAAGRLHASIWSARFQRNPVDMLFPGGCAIVLAGVAIWSALRTRVTRTSAASEPREGSGDGGVPASKRGGGAGGAKPPGQEMPRVLMLVCLGVVGFVLSLGIRTPVYEWLYAAFPPMRGLRVAARFGNLFLLAAAILAGLGLAALRRSPWRAGRSVAVAIVILAVVNIEALRAPLQYQRFEGIPAIYRLLATEPGHVVLAETPFYPAHATFENGEYVLNSTAHWRPLMNGYSGYTPASYRRIAWTFWNFPREDAVQAMREAGVTHFTVHPRRLGSRAEQTIERLSQRSDVELLAVSARRGPMLYRFR